MKRIFLVLFAVLLLPFQSFTENKNLLFVIQDAGETYAFLPLMTRLAKGDASFQVLAGGVAEEILSKERLLQGYLCHFSDFGLPVDKSWQRDKRISEVALQALTDHFSPKIVIGGVAFELQGQLFEVFQKKGARTFAYWDNFGENGANPYFSTAHKVQKLAQVLLLPSENLASSPFFQDREKFVVGQPALDAWRSLVPLMKGKKQLNIAEEKKVIVYVGGYGKEYEEGFQLLLKGLSKGKFEDFIVIVLPHPKTDGSFEKTATAKVSLAVDVRVLTGFPTKDIASIADLILCHQSTVGTQALAIPKPICFLIPEAQSFQNPLIEKGWVKRLGEKDDLEKEVRLSLKEHPIDLYKAMGIPENGTDNLYELVEDHLGILSR